MTNAPDTNQAQGVERYDCKDWTVCADGDSVSYEDYAALELQLSAFQQRLQAAEADAARYQWLRGNAFVSWATGYRDAETSWHFPEFRTELFSRTEYESQRHEIDAALDAAIDATLQRDRQP